MTKIKQVGSKAQVFHGNAYQTYNYLKRQDLIQNSRGRIVERRRHNAAMKSKNRKRTMNALSAYHFKPGHKRRRTRRRSRSR